MKLVRLLFYLLLLTLPLGQLGRLPVGGEYVNLYLPDVLIFLIIFVWLGYALAIRKKLELPPLANSIFLFAFIALISLINGKRFVGMGEFLVGSMYWVRWVVYAGLYFVVWDIVRAESGEQRVGERKTSTLNSQLSTLLIFSGVVLALAGFVQLLVLPDFTKLDPSLGWDPHKNRLASTFLDPNFCGAFLVLTLTLLFSRILYDEKVKKVKREKKVVWGILGAVVFGALILTFSRSAWLMFAVSMGVMGVLKSKKLLILALVAFLAAYALVPRVQTRIAGGVDPDDSAQARISSWKDTLEIVQDNPLIGVGFNTFRYAQARYGFFGFREPFGGRAGAGADSSLLLVLATTGIVGLTVFLLMGFKALWPVLSCPAPFTRPSQKATAVKPWMNALGRVILRSFSEGGSATEGVALRSLSEAPRGATPVKAWGSTNTKRCGINLAVLAGFAGLLAESSFINSLFYPWIMVWYWVMLGIVDGF